MSTGTPTQGDLPPAESKACPPWCFRHELDEAGDEAHDSAVWRLRATGGRHDGVSTCASRVRRPDGEMEGTVTVWVGIDDAILTPAEAQAFGLALLEQSFRAEVDR